MRALVYLGPGQMELQDAPDPTPEPGEVVIRSRLSAICGSDLHGFREASPRRIPPLVMGHETVGEVASVGEGVDPSRVGARAVLKPILSCGRCAYCLAGDINLCAEGRLVGRDLSGGFAELFAVPAGAAVPIPDALTDELATLTEPLANAVHVASRAVREGDEVLVIGSGPIGVLMAKAAGLYGATGVSVTDPIAERLGFAKAQGAEPIEGDPVEVVMDRTFGRGVDVVIDAAGFEQTWALGLRAVRGGGRIEQVGLGAGSGVVDYFGVIGKEASITGSFAWNESDFTRAIALLEEGAVDPAGWVTQMPLEDGQRAFEELVDGRDLFKVVLTL